MASNAKILEEAGTLHKKAAGSLYAAAQWAKDGNQREEERHTNQAMHYIESANKLLGKI